jgi:hypothetical protein
MKAFAQARTSDFLGLEESYDAASSANAGSGDQQLPTEVTILEELLLEAAALVTSRRDIVKELSDHASTDFVKQLVSTYSSSVVSNKSGYNSIATASAVEQNQLKMKLNEFLPQDALLDRITAANTSFLTLKESIASPESERCDKVVSRRPLSFLCFSFYFIFSCTCLCTHDVDVTHSFIYL